MSRIIFETDDKLFRIVELVNYDMDMETLKGDCYNPEHMLEMCGPEMTLERLREEEIEFEELVNREGCFGYVLERWNPEPGCGYEHVDSCWGFVGQYAPGDSSGKFNHYIVDEMLQIIRQEVAS